MIRKMSATAALLVIFTACEGKPARAVDSDLSAVLKRLDSLEEQQHSWEDQLREEREKRAVMEERLLKAMAEKCASPDDKSDAASTNTNALNIKGTGRRAVQADQEPEAVTCAYDIDDDDAIGVPVSQQHRA